LLPYITVNHQNKKKTYNITPPRALWIWRHCKVTHQHMTDKPHPQLSLTDNRHYLADAKCTQHSYGKSYLESRTLTDNNIKVWSPDYGLLGYDGTEHKTISCMK